MNDKDIEKLLLFAADYPEDYNKIATWFNREFNQRGTAIYLILLYFYHNYMKGGDNN